MPEHELKTCPRCNSELECKVGDINHCHCNHVKLNIEERCFIEERYNDCLCIDCLLQLKNRYTFFKEKFLKW